MVQYKYCQGIGKYEFITFNRVYQGYLMDLIKYLFLNMTKRVI